MIVGVGMDLCQISRISLAIEKHHFVERVYTEREAERIREASELRRAEIAAGLFAAKEAVAKALGTGFHGFFTTDIEITPDPLGRPACALSGGALERARKLCDPAPFALWLTITHENGMAAATAILEARE